MSEHIPDSIEQVILSHDLDQLNDAQKVQHYKKMCEFAGVHPLTRPFEYIRLNGKLTLYVTRQGTDQLRKVHGVSILDMQHEELNGCLIVSVTGKDKTGRTDVAMGAIDIGMLKGESRANAIMKCETKAKRRLTLSLCGCGVFDEGEYHQQDPATLSTDEPVIGRQFLEKLAEAREQALITAEQQQQSVDAYYTYDTIKKEEYAKQGLGRLRYLSKSAREKQIL